MPVNVYRLVAQLPPRAALGAPLGFGRATPYNLSIIYRPVNSTPKVEYYDIVAHSFGYESYSACYGFLSTSSHAQVSLAGGVELTIHGAGFHATDSRVSVCEQDCERR